MKTTNRIGFRMNMAGIGLSLGWVMSVSASPYAYPQYPGYAYGTPPGHAAPVYAMPDRPGHMPQAEVNRPSASAAGQTQPTTTGVTIVTVGQMRFEPSIITVKVGEKVTWKQSGRMPHTVTANDKSFGSQRLQLNDEYSQTFENPGIHTYYCRLHPSMQGVVKVVE